MPYLFTPDPVLVNTKHFIPFCAVTHIILKERRRGIFLDKRKVRWEPKPHSAFAP